MLVIRAPNYRQKGVPVIIFISKPTLKLISGVSVYQLVLLWAEYGRTKSYVMDLQNLGRLITN